LVRDFNSDVLRRPFDEELKEIMRGFALLLKSIVQTVDEHGLRARFLRRHAGEVQAFYLEMEQRSYRSELAASYQKRLLKNRTKLFTFLDFDGVPWNNNNAEHAIKAVVGLRNVIGGSSSEKGMGDYLTLLSICETCKCRGVSFLDFLRSGETDVEKIAKRGRTPIVA
jgi:hypothetical protein